jgi:hypothetical protein
LYWTTHAKLIIPKLSKFSGLMLAKSFALRLWIAKTVFDL